MGSWERGLNTQIYNERNNGGYMHNPSYTLDADRNSDQYIARRNVKPDFRAQTYYDASNPIAGGLNMVNENARRTSVTAQMSQLNQRGLAFVDMDQYGTMQLKKQVKSQEIGSQSSQSSSGVDFETLLWIILGVAFVVFIASAMV